MAKRDSSSNRPSSRQPRDWRGQRSGAPAARGYRRSLRKWLLFCTTLLVLVALVVFFYDLAKKRYPPVRMLVFTVTDYYDAPVPPNAWAQEDAERFASTWTDKPTSWSLADIFPRNVEVQVTWKPTVWSSADVFLRAVSDAVHNARPGGPDKNVILLYISAHGLVDDEGHPVLLLGTGKASPTTEPPVAARLPECVRIEALLERLKSHRPSGSHLVLFLDAGQIESNWQLGVLYNGFADELPKAVASAGVDNLHVLSAAKPGQTAWTIPHRGCSAFGWAVRQGLKGAADNDPQDRVVTLAELQRYVRQHLKTQVGDLLAVEQVPEYLGSDAKPDLKLTYINISPFIEPTREREADEAANLALDEELWKVHAQCRPGKIPPAVTLAAERRYLLSWEALEQGLLRLEAFEDAGAAYTQSAKQLRSGLQALAAELRKSRPAGGIVPDAPSLPLTLQVTSQRAAALRTRLREHLPAAVKDAKPVDDLSPPELAWAAWDWLITANESGSVGAIDAVLELLAQCAARPPQPRSEASECSELRMLRQFRGNGHLPDSVRRDWPLLRESLALRQAAETSASLGAERLALDGVRLFVDQGDRPRRQSQDQLFVARPTEARTSLARARTFYQQAQQAETDLALVLTTRDRAWLEAPHYLQWAVGRRNEEDVTTCEELLKATTELDRNLHKYQTAWRDTASARSEDTSSDVRNQFARLTEKAKGLQRQLADLRGRVNQNVREVIEHTEDRSTRRLIHALLRTPLVTAEDRQQLRSAYRRPATDDSSAPKPGSKAAQGPTAATGNLVSATFWVEFPQFSHPALWLLPDAPRPAAAESPASGPADRARRVAQLGNLAREVRQRLGRLVADGGTPGQPSAAAGPDSAWIARTQTARDTHAAITLLNLADCTRWGQAELRLRDPFGELERYYEVEFWLWHARRALDDFFGDDGLPTATDKPYFALAAERCLRKAEAEGYPKLEATAQIRKLLQSRLAACQAWLKLEAPDVELRQQATEFPQQLRLQWAESLPPGEAALALDIDRRQRAEFRVRSDAEQPYVTILPRTIPADQNTAQQDLSLVCRPAAEAAWEFGCYYRGHYRLRKFQVAVHHPEQVTVYRPPGDRRAHLLVQGNKNPGIVALAVDCSHSMEGAKMEGAIAALRFILRELQYHPGYSVSLWLFGHRRYADFDNIVNGVCRQTWNPKWQSNTNEKDDPLVRFENDVQRVWQSDDFRVPDGAARSAVDETNEEVFKRWLKDDGITAWGYTPLHLAMVKATEDHLVRSLKPGARRLIVLSDGVDNVGQENKGFEFNPLWKFDRERHRTEHEVAQALSKANRGAEEPIRVFVVADLEQPGTLDALRDTIRAGGTDCRILPADFRNDTLRHELRRSLGLFRYNIKEQASGRPINSEELRLNTRFEFQVAKPQPCTVELGYGVGSPVATAKLMVEGGEALLLTVAESGNGLQLKYEPDPPEGDGAAHSQPPVANPSAVPRDPDFNPAAFLVSARAERPPGDHGEVLFRVSVQNAQPEHFSPRPAEVWTEITPLEPQDDGRLQPAASPLVFTDLTYDAGRRSPVLQFAASPWPAKATRAEFEMWFKLQKTPAKEAQIERVRRTRDDDFANDLALPGLRFSVQVRTFQDAKGNVQEVLVVEQREPAAAASGARVELSGNPEAIRREYFPKAGRVEHRFQYRDVRESDVMQCWLSLTSAEALKSGAARFKPAAPLHVRSR